MSKAWIEDSWIKAAEITLPDGTTTRLQPTAQQLRNIKNIPEHFRSTRYGRGKRWRVIWRDEQNTKHSRAFATKIEAEAYTAELEDDIRSGRYIDPTHAEQLIEQIAPEWYETKRAVKPSTRLRYKRELHRFIMPAWGKTPLRAITPRRIDAWVKKLSDGTAPVEGRKLKPQSADSIYHIAGMTLGGILKYATKQRYIQANPMAEVVLPVDHLEEVEELPVLSLTQVERLAEIIHHPLYAPFTLLLAYSGLRLGEAIGLRCGDIDIEKRRAHIRRTLTRDENGKDAFGTPKTGKARAIPLHGFLLPALAEMAGGQPASAPLFRVRGGGHINPSNYRSRVFTPALKQLKSEFPESLGDVHITIHDLRHTATTHAIAAGADVKVVQTMLGHATATETLDRYGHLWPDRLDEVTDAVSAARERLLNQ